MKPLLLASAISALAAFEVIAITAGFAGSLPFNLVAPGIIVALGLWTILAARAAEGDRVALLATLKGLEGSLERHKDHALDIDKLRAEHDRLKAEGGRLKGELLAAHAEARTTGKEAAAAGVVAFLGRLQEKGRLVDFLMDDITRYPDAAVGAAARVVHQGSAAVVKELLDIAPLHEGAEGETMTLSEDYNADRYRLIGHVGGHAPFRGRVVHRGWLTLGIRLPERSNAATPAAGYAVIAPAEVEIS